MADSLTALRKALGRSRHHDMGMGFFKRLSRGFLHLHWTRRVYDLQ